MALKGLPGRKRRDAARAGFINTSMRPSGRRAPMVGDSDRRPHRHERQQAV
jgi:hypothetical protein